MVVVPPSPQDPTGINGRTVVPPLKWVRSPGGGSTKTIHRLRRSGRHLGLKLAKSVTAPIPNFQGDGCLWSKNGERCYYHSTMSTISHSLF